MTITEVYNGNEYAYCEWYDFNTNVWFEKRVFPVIALKSPPPQQRLSRL